MHKDLGIVWLYYSQDSMDLPRLNGEMETHRFKFAIHVHVWDDQHPSSVDIKKDLIRMYGYYKAT